MAGASRTPANARLGIDVPKVFDSKGTIGKQFTSKRSSIVLWRATC